MHGWKLTLGLCGVALGAALLAPRLFPILGGTAAGPAPEPPIEVVEPVAIAAEPVIEPVSKPPRTIDLVVALDTSGSMDRLIDSTRARLWDIVNEIDARDPEAILRVALVTYGSPSYGAENDYVKVQLDLTEDLDAVYARAWELQTDGGDEYVGSVIERSVQALSWASADNTDNRRLMFVAGNETAALGPVPFQLAARGASNNHGVIVNTLFAGTKGAGEALRWHEVAQAGGGRFMAIDAEISAVAVQTPYDRQLEALNRDLNGTYVRYNAEGRRKMEEIEKNDKAAGSLGLGSLASRVGTKGSSKHKVDSWDLVSGLEKGTVDFDDVDMEALPDDLQGLDTSTLQKAVAEKARKRAEVKAQIEEVQKKRSEHLREAARNESGAGLDEAMSEALAQQL